MNAADRCLENIRLLERGYTAFADEYKEQAEIWRTLETKAQGLIGASGLFLAAAFAFSREPTLLVPTKIIVLLTISSLVWAVLAALSVLRISEFSFPDGVNAVQDVKAAVSKPSEAVGERYEAFLLDQLQLTDEIIKSIERANELKHSKLAAAQTLVAFAALLTVAATLINMVWHGSVRL